MLNLIPASDSDTYNLSLYKQECEGLEDNQEGQSSGRTIVRKDKSQGTFVMDVMLMKTNVKVKSRQLCSQLKYLVIAYLVP